MSWLDDLHYDPIPPLLASEHTAVIYWTRRDLLHEDVAPVHEALWDLPIPTRIVRHQTSEGSWRHPTKHTSDALDYDQIETYREMGFLVIMFGFDTSHPAIVHAADYIFSKQSPEGDFRGIYARQYTPNYTAALLELLVRSGYENDPRVLRAFAWLDSIRQDDGGWALPFRTHGRNLDAIYEGDEQLQPDRTKPLSHLVTGVVLRAYAAHNEYRHSDVAKEAARLLVSRFFERDTYPDKNRVDDWTRFSFPFWQADILSSLDSIGQIDPILASHEKARQAKQWFIDHQQPDGLFTGHLLKDRYHDLQLWYSYAICRALARLSDADT